jgi:hypothetical protein
MAFVLEKDVPLDFVMMNGVGQKAHRCFSYVAVDREREAFVWGGARTIPFDFRNSPEEDYVNSFNYILILKGQQYVFRLEKDEELAGKPQPGYKEGKPYVYAWKKVLGVYDAADKNQLDLPAKEYEKLVQILKEGMQVFGKPSNLKLIPNFIVTFDF